MRPSARRAVLVALCALAVGAAHRVSAQDGLAPCTAAELEGYLVCPPDAIHCGPVYFERQPELVGQDRPGGLLIPPGFLRALPDSVGGVRLDAEAAPNPVQGLTLTFFWVSEQGEPDEVSVACAPNDHAVAEARERVENLSFVSAELRGRPARFPLVWVLSAAPSQSE